MALCTSCGTDNPARAKFCLECGAELPVASEGSGGARKLVTVLFADVVGSTALGEQLDPETMRAGLARYFAAARTVLERHGGTVEKFIGDAVMAVFGIPLLHEDDALRAVRAAIELREEIARLNEQLSAERGLRIQFRIGVNSGMVVAGGGEGSGSFVTGDAVNMAARLEQAAAAGDVLIGEATYRLVRDYVTVEPSPPVAAKGKSEDLRAHRLVGMASGTEAASASRAGGFVGRRRELARLGEAFDDAVDERRCFLFTLLGSAGVGKSRLVAEFIGAHAADATVLRGRCLPYGEGITYWPVGEIVRSAVGAGDDVDAAALRAGLGEVLAPDPSGDQVAELLTSMLGITTVNAPAEERSWAVRRFLEAVARNRPLICLIEDIHWAEPALLELIESVADWTRDAPMMVLCTARPELLEARPTWGGGKLNASTILLEPLNAAATRELVSGLVARAGLDAGVVDQILETAEGNPLFAEEIVRMLADDVGRTDGGQVLIPTSVQAVIAARLDRLPAQERLVAQRAAVAGRVFERGAVLELVREDEQQGVPAALLSLMRKELVQPSQPDVTADEAFRFRHMLIRDTAYDALPKQDRADLHERFAGWVDRVAAERADEYAEIVGYHLESALRYRRELGLEDARSAALAERAGTLLAGAGRRAYLRGERDGSASLLSRAVDLLADGPARRASLVKLALASNHQTGWRLALSSAQRLQEESRSAGDEAGALKGWLLAISPRMFSDPTYVPSLEAAQVVAARETFEKLGDEEGLAIAEDALSVINLTLGRWAEAGAAAERGLGHALAAGDGRIADTMRFWMVNAALWGPTPVPKVIEICDEMLDVIESRSTRATIHGQRAFAWAMAGDGPRSRADTEESLRIQRELGDPTLAWSFAAAPAEGVLGDHEAAEAAVAWNIRILERTGETGQHSSMYGFRARNRFEHGAPDDEVIHYAEECRRLASADDMVSQLQWRAALALVAARAGRIDDAKRWLGEAEAVLEETQTDFLWELGLTAQDRGYVHEQAGELAEARRAYEQALSYFEQKGDVMDAGRARASLERLNLLGQ